MQEEPEAATTAAEERITEGEEITAEAAPMGDTAVTAAGTAGTRATREAIQ